MAAFKESQGRIFIASDWHGDYSMYVQAKKKMTSKDRLYYLGDSVDRGPCPIKLFLALSRDPQVTFIMGNHEEMMYRIFIAPDYDEWDRLLWFDNGGRVTYNQFYDIQDEQILEEFYTHLTSLYERTQCLVIQTSDKKVFFLSHAGFSFNTGETIDYLWGRQHMLNKIEKNEQLSNHWIIHGHTPVQTLPWNHKKQNIEVDFYDFHKIDIDLGTFISHKAALLPLDDLDNPIYLTTDNKLNEQPNDFSSGICIYT